MYESHTEVERIARHRIAERTRPAPAVPLPPRRTRLAAQLRRFADTLDG